MMYLGQELKSYDGLTTWVLHTEFVTEDSLVDELLWSLAPLCHIVVTISFNSSESMRDDLVADAMSKLSEELPKWDMFDSPAGMTKYVRTTIRRAMLAYLDFYNRNEFDYGWACAPVPRSRIPGQSEMELRIYQRQLRKLARDRAYQSIRFKDPVDVRLCRRFLESEMGDKKVDPPSMARIFKLKPARAEFLAMYARIVYRKSMYEVRESDGYR